MIGVTHSMYHIVTVNDPVTPVFSAPATMTSTNNLAGSGTFSFQFNATKRTATTSATGSVSGSGASSFQYFNSGALVDPQDYEVMVTLGTNVGFSNIATAGGSATLGVWHTLSTSPLFSFTCSARRGGSRPIDVTVRHRVNTGVTATTSITMNQSSDAVVPVFGGSAGTTTVHVKTAAVTVLGAYIDNESTANNGRIRLYKDGVINSNVGWSFSTGSIPESEYEMRIVPNPVITPSGSMTYSFGVSFSDISTLRAQVASISTGPRFSAALADAAGLGTMTMQIRHKLDQAKTANSTFGFQTS